MMTNNSNMVNVDMPLKVAYKSLLTDINSYAIYKCSYKDNPEMYVLSKLQDFDATDDVFVFSPIVHRWKMKGDEKFIPYFVEETINDFEKVDGIQSVYLYPSPRGEEVTVESIKKMSDVLKLIYEFTENSEFVVDTKGEGIDFFKEMSKLYGGGING